MRRVEEGNKARRTYDWYRDYLQDFVRFAAPDCRVATLTVDRLVLAPVSQWADSHPGWRSGERGALTAVQRAFSWAARAGLLRSVGGRSPLAGLEKPPQGRRDQLVSEQEYKDVLSVLTCPEARDLVELAWETGMRPAELCSFEARLFEPGPGRLVFPVRLTKGKKTQRVVYLSDRAPEKETPPSDEYRMTRRGRALRPHARGRRRRRQRHAGKAEAGDREAGPAVLR
jgi:integrase